MPELENRKSSSYCGLFHPHRSDVSSALWRGFFRTRALAGRKVFNIYYFKHLISNGYGKNHWID